MKSIKSVKGTKITLLSMVLLAYAASSQAAPIAITNFGFESPSLGAGGIANGVATGWTVSNSNAGVWYPTAGSYFNAAAPEGNQILFVGFGSPADVNQTPLAATVQANMTYTLSFLLGQRLDLPLSTYSVSLEANGTTVLGSDSAGSPTAGNFNLRTIIFNSGASPATLGQPLGIFIHASGSSVTGASGQADFDKFSLDGSPTGAPGVPEPATYVLIGAGITVIMLSRRRLQKQN